MLYLSIRMAGYLEPSFEGSMSSSLIILHPVAIPILLHVILCVDRAEHQLSALPALSILAGILHFQVKIAL